MLMRMSPTSPRSSRSRALRARDAGLRKISFVTRVFVVGSVTAAGAFTALAAWAQPGRSKTTVTGSAARDRGGRLVVPTTGVTRRSAPGPSSTSPSSSAAPATSPATVAPSTEGNTGGYALAPPTTLPDPGYQYTAPVVVSGAS
jgi:hypothetical protein